MFEKVSALGLSWDVLLVVWEDVALEDPAVGVILLEVSVYLLDDSCLRYIFASVFDENVD